MKSISLSTISLVTWDVDGTLYSLRRMKYYLLGQFLREIIGSKRRLAHRELSELRYYRQKIDRARAKGGALDGNLRNEVDFASLEALRQRWYVEAVRKAGPRPGVDGVLIGLRKKGIPQVVFSDYDAESKLKSLGLADRFEALYIGERLGFVKPHAALLKSIAADFSVPIESVVHVGDRVDRDEAAARAAGCQCLIFGRDFRNFQSLARFFGC